MCFVSTDCRNGVPASAAFQSDAPLHDFKSSLDDAYRCISQPDTTLLARSMIPRHLPKSADWYGLGMGHLRSHQKGNVFMLCWKPQAIGIYLLLATTISTKVPTVKRNHRIDTVQMTASKRLH